MISCLIFSGCIENNNTGPQNYTISGRVYTDEAKTVPAYGAVLYIQSSISSAFPRVLDQVKTNIQNEDGSFSYDYTTELVHSCILVHGEYDLKGDSLVDGSKSHSVHERYYETRSAFVQAEKRGILQMNNLKISLQDKIKVTPSHFKRNQPITIEFPSYIDEFNAWSLQACTNEVYQNVFHEYSSDMLGYEGLDENNTKTLVLDIPESTPTGDLTLEILCSFTTKVGYRHSIYYHVVVTLED